MYCDRYCSEARVRASSSSVRSIRARIAAVPTVTPHIEQARLHQ